MCCPLSALGTAGGGILGGIFGQNSQASSAEAAAQAQEQIEQQNVAMLQQQAAAQRGAVACLEPYSQGASQAASAMQGSAPYLAPGQGAVFGGQTVNPGTGGAVNYASLLNPSSTASNVPSRPGITNPASTVGLQSTASQAPSPVTPSSGPSNTPSAPQSAGTRALLNAIKGGVPLQSVIGG